MDPEFTYNPDLQRTIRWALPSVWSGSRVKGILKGITENLQILEDTTLEIRTALQFQSATGEMLDIWGDIYGEPRAGLEDGRYRDVIKAKIEVLSSRGTTPEIQRLLEAISDGEVTLDTRFPAAYFFNITVDEPLSQAEAKRIERLLRTATPAGVGFEGLEAPSSPFRLDEPSLDNRELGRLL